MRRKVIMAKELELLLRLPKIIFGAEGEGEGAGSDSSGSSNSSSDDPNAGEENAGSSSEADSGEDSKGDEATAALRKALESERKQRAAAEKRAKAYEKAHEEEELAKKGEVEQERHKAETAQAKLDKLRNGFRTEKLNSAIRAAASNFIDPSDAIAGVDISLIEIEQDEDDPSVVTIDEKSVKAAVKALATKKPHFLRQGTTDGEKTGSQFGAGQGRSKPQGDEAIRDRYPALR